MIEQITVPTFVSVSAETRAKLREIFKIPYSSHAQVVTDSMGRSTLLSDGTTNEDLKSLTVEKMQDFLGSVAINDSVHDLFRRVVEKIEYKEPPKLAEPIEVPTTTTPVPVPETTAMGEVKADSKVEDGVIKCGKCAFESKSKFAMRMHVGKKHK